MKLFLLVADKATPSANIQSVIGIVIVATVMIATVAIIATFPFVMIN